MKKGKEMTKTYEQIRIKEKIFNITAGTFFFIVGFALIIALLSFISSI